MSNAPLPSLPPLWEAELGKEDRIELAYVAWVEARGPGNRILSITKAAKRYSIPKSILADRIKGSIIVPTAHKS